MPLIACPDIGGVVYTTADSDSTALQSASNGCLEDDVEAGTSEPLQDDLNGHMNGGAPGFAFLHYTKQKFTNLPSRLIQLSDHPLPEV